MISAKIEIPGHPPSANRIWRNVGRKVLTSRAYRKWRDGAVSLILLQARDAIIGKPWEAEILLYGLDRRSDLDNRIKALIDALVSSGVVPDDRHLDRLLVRRLAGAPRTIVRVAARDGLHRAN